MKKDTFVMRYKPSVISLYLEGLPKCYIGYKQVMGKFKIRHNGMTQTREPPKNQFDRS